MKIYLSGKITGDSGYKNKFDRMAAKLEQMGHTVFNPAILPDGFKYETYMAVDLIVLAECDGICLLSDWRDSPGARREYDEAERLGLDIIFAEEADKYLQAS